MPELVRRHPRPAIKEVEARVMDHVEVGDYHVTSPLARLKAEVDVIAVEVWGEALIEAKRAHRPGRERQ